MSAGTGFDVRLGTRVDEPDIRALVGSVPMPGDVSVRFAREPDYFLGTTIMGDPCDVIVARARDSGGLAGIACRAERPAFVNGAEARLGYVGQIRIAEGFRGLWLVQRGARLVREISPPGMVYFGVIARGNPRARDVLLGGRSQAGLRSAFVSGITTCAIVLRPRRAVDMRGVEVAPAPAVTMPEVVAFLRERGARRQLFPAYVPDDFEGGMTMRGLAPADIMVARRGGAVVGVMAVWDQSAYKQDVVEAYGPGLRRARPAYDALARLVGARVLTPPGSAIPLAFAACVAVDEDDLFVMRALLSACAHSAHERGKSYLMIGLADGDPLLAEARRWLHVTYRSDLFAFSWSADPGSALDGRVPYIEIATL